MTPGTASLDHENLAKVSRLFEALDAEGRHALLSSSTHRLCIDGEVICREGEIGDDMYIIASGEVRVTADDLGQEKELSILRAGTFFGEMAALNGQRRTATVTALGDVELVVFPFAAVQAVLRDRPRAKEVLAQAGIQRTEETMQKLME